tara:strand:+ start:6685 stop:6828 length:144 start_codon:yes stop_codon:yes gene_type:complete
MEIVKTKEGEFKISDNKVFLLLLPNPTDIYIKETELEKVKMQNPDFF